MTSTFAGNTRAHGRRQRGLTLIEMLVAMTIGLIIVGGVLYVYMGSKGAYRVSKSTSRIQEAGRFGLDAIMRDVREVGYIGCGSRMSPASLSAMTVYQIANPPLTLATPAQAVMGYSAGSWPVPGGINVPWVAGDVLVLRIAVGEPVLMTQNPNPATPAIYLANNCGRLKTGDYVMVSSCTASTILRVANSPDVSPASCPATKPAVAATPVEIDHGQTSVAGARVNGNPPANLTALTAPNQPPMTMAALPTAQQFNEVVYYVGQLAGRPAPALYRYSFSDGQAEEIIDHVENMSVVYGVSNGVNNVTFQTADAVTAANNWPNVVSVRVSLLAVGDELGAVDTPQTLQFGATNSAAAPVTILAADTRLRQVFTGTAALRDRLQ